MTPLPKQNIEDVISSKTRLKILKVLMDSQLTPTEIARAAGTNYLIVEQHLEVLEAEAILEHMKFGSRIRYYRFNEGSPKARAVKNLIEVFQNAAPTSGDKKANQCLIVA